MNSDKSEKIKPQDQPLTQGIPEGLRPKSRELKTLLDISESESEKVTERLDRLGEWASEMTMSPFPGRRARRRLSLLLGGGKVKSNDSHNSTQQAHWPLQQFMQWMHQQSDLHPLVLEGWSFRSMDNKIEVQESETPALSLIWVLESESQLPDLNWLKEHREIFEEVSLAGTQFQFLWAKDPLSESFPIQGLQFEGGILNPWD